MRVLGLPSKAWLQQLHLGLFGDHFAHGRTRSTLQASHGVADGQALSHIASAMQQSTRCVSVHMCRFASILYTFLQLNQHSARSSVNRNSSSLPAKSTPLQSSTLKKPRKKPSASKTLWSGLNWEIKPCVCWVKLVLVIWRCQNARLQAVAYVFEMRCRSRTKYCYRILLR